MTGTQIAAEFQKQSFGSCRTFGTEPSRECYAWPSFAVLDATTVVICQAEGRAAQFATLEVIETDLGPSDETFVQAAVQRSLLFRL